MKIYRAGTKVKTKIGGIKAFIVAVSIEESSISYKISYFKSGEHTTCWLLAFEIEIDIETRAAGFGVKINTEDKPLLIEIN